MPARFDKLQISNIGYYGTQYGQTRSAGYINTTDSSSNRYIHIKLNVGGDDSMWMADAVGYNYGNASIIRCSWGWYAYQNNIYSASYSNGYNGLSASNIYAASDWSTVIVAYASTVYYSGFTLNIYNMRQNATGQANPAITTWTISSSSSPVY